MKKAFWIFIEVCLIGVAILLGVLAQDRITQLFTFVMVAIIVFSIWFGMMPLIRYLDAFDSAIDNIQTIVQRNEKSNWTAARDTRSFFKHKELDELFDEYMDNVQRQRKHGLIIADIGDYINEEMLFNHSWQGVMQQIPGTLTGMGILGTFIGIILSVQGIQFTDMEAALVSIQMLLNGIGTAFFTSFAGIVLSICFNISEKILWNVTEREMGIFTEQFYRYIIPSEDEQERYRKKKEMQDILERMDRMPAKGNFDPSRQPGREQEESGEAALIAQISEGLKENEFTFYLQPIYDLNNRRVIGAEALVRWRHPKLGILTPSAFMSTIEKNGYITKLDYKVWEEVCQTIRLWIDQGKHVVPITVNISKMDILALDIVKFFSDMIGKYRIPPMYIEIDIQESAYMQIQLEAIEAERNLRQLGFRVAVDGFDGDFMKLQSAGDISPDMLKLDLNQLEKNKRDIAMTIDQANKLNINLTAVGIENMEQLAILRKSGCFRGQGYYLAKPISIEAFVKEINQ